MENLKFIGHVNEEFRNLVANSHTGHITWLGQDFYIDYIKGTLERLPLDLLVAVNIDTYNDNTIILTTNYSGYTFKFSNYGVGKQKILTYYIFNDRFHHNDVKTALAQVNKENLLDVPNFYKAPKLDKLKKALVMRIDAYEITKTYVDENQKQYQILKGIFLNAGFKQFHHSFERTVKMDEFITLHLVIEMSENSKYFHIKNGSSSTTFSITGDNYITKAMRISEFVHDSEERYKKSMGL